MREHERFRTCALQMIQNMHLWFKILNSWEINMQSRLFCLQMVILPHWFCSAVWFFNVCIPGSWGSWLRNKILVTVHGYLLHIWKGNSVTENRLLEADLALPNSMQRQGIKKKKIKNPFPTLPLIFTAVAWRFLPVLVDRLVVKRLPSPALPGVSAGRDSRRAARCSARWGASLSLPLPRMTQSVIKDFQLPAKNGIRSGAPEGRGGDVRNGFCSCLRFLTHTHMRTHARRADVQLVWEKFILQ